MPTNSDLLQRAIEAARANRTDEARKLLLLAIELDDHDEQAWLWLSSVVESQNDRRVCLENVLDLNPNNRAAQKGLRWLDEHAPVYREYCPHCDAVLPASGDTCPTCKQPVLIVCPHCDEFTEVRKPQCLHCGHFFGDFKQRSKFYGTLAGGYADEGKLALAQWALDQAVASAPHESQDWARIAAVRVKLDRPDDAIAAYQQALTRAPGDLQIYASLHDLYHRGQLDAEAQGVLDQVWRQYQADHDRLIEFGQILMDRRRPATTALRFYQRAVELQPQNAATRLQIGALYFDSGNAATARQHFAEAVKLTEAKSTLGQQARQALARAKAARRTDEGAGSADGGGVDVGRGNDRIRQMAGPWLISIMAALANAQLSPLNISPISWAALIGSGVGAYLWQAAGEPGYARSARSLIGMGLWFVGFGLIVIKV